MKLIGLLAGSLGLTALAVPALALTVTTSADPYLWLEDVESGPSLDWVAKQNLSTTTAIEAVPDYSQIAADTKAIILAKDEVPFSKFRHGYFYNFWQDAQSKHGLLRRTTLDEYRKPDPKWEVLLDLDKLSKDEGENWVLKGATQLDENSSRYLIRLSRGGKDATTVREYDYETRRFITDGFNVPEGKTLVTPLSEGEVLIGTTFDPKDVTNAGYPRSIKLWKRGEPLASAPTVFRGAQNDANMDVSVHRDGSSKHVTITRLLDFYHVEQYLYENGGLRQLPLPVTASLVDIDANFIYAQIKEDVNTGRHQIASNTIVRLPLNAIDLANAEPIFSANSRQTIEDVSVSKAGVFIKILDNVRNKVLRLNQGPTGEWASTTLPFPDTGVLDFSPRDDRDASSMPLLTYTDYLTPKTQYLVHDEDSSYRLEALKSAPARFKADGMVVEQKMAQSADGTSIPYFIIHKKDLKLDGNNPTVLYGYGGFEISLTPSYSGVIGKAWLERGGVYVVANIRGGGEFGPAWHMAALKHNRQRAYDDFIAVAEHLISTKVTSPAHLGIAGGSNGGLLVGAVMVQRPELFNAVLCEVPLLDMQRYSQLLAGASWIGEYGDPADPADLSYILRYSPYQNLRADRKYPKPLLITSTKDDRVHPGHARKFAARMNEQGHPYFFYENVNGGHARSGNLDEKARITALEYTYLWSQLR